MNVSWNTVHLHRYSLNYIFIVPVVTCVMFCTVADDDVTDQTEFSYLVVLSFW